MFTCFYFIFIPLNRYYVIRSFFRFSDARLFFQRFHIFTFHIDFYLSFVYIVAFFCKRSFQANVTNTVFAFALYTFNVSMDYFTRLFSFSRIFSIAIYNLWRQAGLWTQIKVEMSVFTTCAHLRNYFSVFFSLIGDIPSENVCTMPFICH